MPSTIFRVSACPWTTEFPPSHVWKSVLVRLANANASHEQCESENYARCPNEPACALQAKSPRATLAERRKSADLFSLLFSLDQILSAFLVHLPMKRGGAGMAP